MISSMWVCWLQGGGPRHAPTVSCSSTGLQELVHTWIPLSWRDVHFTQALQGARALWGLRGTEEGPMRSAVWSQVQENTWHSISSQETNDVGPAQPFASLTSHGSLSVCFLIWWVEMHSHVHFQSEHRDSVEKSGRSPWQMPGPQYSTCGAALSVCVTHRAIFLHPQASGLARTPGASG